MECTTRPNWANLEDRLSIRASRQHGISGPLPKTNVLIIAISTTSHGSRMHCEMAVRTTECVQLMLRVSRVVEG
jgi:hypothetical protein